MSQRFFDRFTKSTNESTFRLTMNEALVSDLSSMETIRDSEKALRLLDQVGNVFLKNANIFSDVFEMFFSSYS